MRRLFIVIILFSLVISACTALQPSPTATPAPATATETTQPSATPQPTATATLAPTASTTPEPTATITLTFTPSHTPGPDFSLAKFAGTGEGKIGTLLLFDIPNLLGEYEATVLQQIYPCSRVKEFPNRLFCDGAVLAPGKEYTTELHPKGSDQVLFSATFYLPFALLPTEPQRARPGGAGTCGPIVCETEIRIEPRSPTGTCEVSSCFDDCGYVRSVDTCSQWQE